MTNQRNICYCGEYGGGVHTRSARCPGGELRTLEGEPALTQSSGLPGTREPVVTAPQGNAGESPPRLLSSNLESLRAAVTEWDSLADAREAMMRENVSFGQLLTMRGNAMDRIIKAARTALSGDSSDGDISIDAVIEQEIAESYSVETSCRYEAAVGSVCNKCGRIHDFGPNRCAECQTPRLCGVERECLRNRYVRPSVQETGPKPDAEKAPVTCDEMCPTWDQVQHEEHNGKCVYCGAPMPSQSKASVDRQIQPPTPCTGCEGKPEFPNIPCSICGMYPDGTSV